MEAKVSAIKDPPEPTNVSELKAFLGVIIFYGKYIKNLSSVLSPLYALLQKERKWDWETRKNKFFVNPKDYCNLLNS